MEVYQTSLHKERNRIEARKVELFDTRWLSDTDKWNLVHKLIRVQRTRECFDTKKKKWINTNQTGFYIVTNPLNAEIIEKAIRNHWGIENQDHYVRDVTMGEDKSRIRINPDIFATLRSFALNIMRSNQVKNIQQERFKNAMRLENILDYNGIKEN